MASCSTFVIENSVTRYHCNRFMYVAYPSTWMPRIELLNSPENVRPSLQSDLRLVNCVAACLCQLCNANDALTSDVARPPIEAGCSVGTLTNYKVASKGSTA
jgi:hypothetical protein